MARAEPQITATYLEGINDYLTARRDGPTVTLPELLRQVGLEVRLPPELHDRIPLDRFTQLLELAAEHTGDDCFGLHLAHAQPIGVTGVFGFLVSNAPDMRTKVELIARYSRLICDSILITYHEFANADMRIRLEFVPPIGIPHKQLLEFFMSLFIVRVRYMTGEKWTPLSAAFTYLEPNEAGEYEQLFGKRLTFNAPVSEMTVSAINIRKRSVTSDQSLFEALAKAAEEELAACKAGSSIKERLEAHLVATLAMGGASLAASAKALELPARRLQAELKKGTTSFESVLADVRRRLAERYLRDTELSMTEIAMMLGFSQIAPFTRAARGWFHVPPTEMRAVLRAQQSG